MSQQEVEFKGYALTDPAKWNDLKVIDFKPKNFSPEDIEIAITHCGVCGSDVHTLTQGWGESKLPLVVGHEIVGTVTRVGEKVTEFKPGDRAGVGAQRGSCLECRECKDGYENYCPKGIDTYNAEYPDGVVAQGGYSTAIRANERFVFPIPDEIESRHAASMMCAGLTVYSPLKTHGAGPGKKVGIMGIGGLGHYAVLWAKAMGAEVFAFTHDDSKAEDIKKMGADHVVNTGKKDFAKDYTRTLDILLSTRDVFGDSTPLGDYLSMLYVHGRFVTVGLAAAFSGVARLAARRSAWRCWNLPVRRASSLGLKNDRCERSGGRCRTSCCRCLIANPGDRWEPTIYGECTARFIKLRIHCTIRNRFRESASRHAWELGARESI